MRQNDEIKRYGCTNLTDITQNDTHKGLDILTIERQPVKKTKKKKKKKKKKKNWLYL